ncbi:MAG: glucokinase [Colwellia sp.]
MTRSTLNTINLIADIGGTNIRIAIADENATQKITQIETFQCTDFSSLGDVLSLYIKNHQIENNKINACLAIACPTDNDLISMTNLPWQFSQKALKETLNLANLTFINDYTAIALSVPLLADDQKVKIGGGEENLKLPIAVCGPGTGLGVAHLVPVSVAGENQWHCYSGEGGHVDFAAIDETDIDILKYLNPLKKRVSYEQLLSGYGLEQIYQALAQTEKQSKEQTKLSAETISKQALNNSCAISKQALSHFCKVLGSFAGNLALTMNAQGGVYIAGGIVPRFIDFLQQSEFRAMFEAKGRLSNIPKQTPTYVITAEQPGLLGAAAYLFREFD